VGSIWAFVQDEANRTVLAWIGGGVVVVVGGVWVVFKFFVDRKPTASATGGGVAAGRDINNSKIDTGGGSKR
jgi:hypothetical protein